MNVQTIHRGSLIANVPVALFTIAASGAGLFGLGTYGWIRIVWIFSPLLLAAWLAASTHLFNNDRQTLAIAMGVVPVLALVFLLLFALNLP